MSAADNAPPRPRTLADLYEGRDLTQAQVRRLVTLLGLTAPKRAGAASKDREAA